MNETEEMPLKNYKMPLEEKQIYILDDDESVLRSLKLLLNSYGFAVDIFSSAEEFFNVVPNGSSGCLVLDIHLTGLNGWETMKKLTKTGYNLPVIVITADKDDHYKERALKAGAVGFLQKPFEDHHLLHMVNRAFNKTGEENEKSK